MHINPAIKPYTKKDGQTYYRFKIYLGVDKFTGKEKSTTKSGFTSEKKAQIEYDKLKYEFKRGLHLARQTKTYKDVYEEWLLMYKNSGIELSTYDKTEGYFKNHILPFFENKKIDKITVKDCEAFGITLSKKLQHFKHVYNYAASVLSTAVKYGYLLNNPFLIADIPREIKKPQHENFLLRDDINKILMKINQKISMSNVLLRLYIYTGIRKSEAIALTWDAIDFNNKIIKIRKTLGNSKEKGRYLKAPKTHEIRDILLDDDTLNFLCEWKKQQQMQLTLHNKKNQKNLVFNGKMDNYLGPNTANKWFNKLLKELRIKHINIQGLRHSHATLLNEAGASLKGISDRLGHEDGHNTTIRTYIHVTQKIKQDTLNLFLDYLNNGK